MSVISNSSYNKKVPLWKVSDQTKNHNKELTVQHSTFQLPERFSPVKKGHNQSRLLNFSMEKLRLSRLQPKKERSPTPKSNQRYSILGEQHVNQRSSTNIHAITPKKQQKFPIVNLNSRDSVFSLNSDQVRNISSEGFRNFIRQYEVNRKMILQLKEQFIIFKTSVLEQMNLQRKMVLEFMTKIQQTYNKSDIKQMGLENQADIIKKVVKDQAAEQTISVLNFQSLIKTAQKSVKIGQPYVQVNNGTQQSKQKSSYYSQSHYANRRDEVMQKQPKNEQIIKQPQSQQQSKQPQASKKSSPHLQKCNHIVETINMLNQINASPVGSPKNMKSTQKLMIEEYKQKIMAITKSNDSLIKEKTRQSLLRNEQQNKLKGTFKLQKFYNAIQKLKEEVNEIKNQNQKQPKKSKIVQ